ncbi:MAG: PqiC family protein [Desulfobacterales bacterium]
MKHAFSALKILCALSLPVLALSGCLFRTSDPVTFYTLSPMPQTAGRTGAVPGTLLAVLPVAIPTVIDRPQIVTRADDNRILMSDTHYWGGSLGDNFTRVLVANLGTLLAAKQVSVLSDAIAPDAAYRLSVVVGQFDGRLADTVRLNASWSLKEPKRQKTLAVGNSVIQEAVTGGGYDELVAAASRAVAALSREIAAEFEKLR